MLSRPLAAVPTGKAAERPGGRPARHSAVIAARHGLGAADRIQLLQRSIGNQATLRLLTRHALAAGAGQPFDRAPRGQEQADGPRGAAGGAPSLQARLSVGAPDDGHEREAESVARQVMAMPDPARGAGRDSGRIQRRPAAGAPSEATGEVEAGIEAARGGGRRLPNAARGFFEPRFGQDFGGVRVHTGPGADTLNRALGARAFTTGSDIFFRNGEYDPGSAAGRGLLAHELTHVVQQGGGAAGLVARPQIRRSPDPPATATSPQGAPAPGADPMGAALSAPALEQIRGEAMLRTFKLGAYTERGARVVDKAKSKMVQFSADYESAYKSYAAVIGSAREEARTQQAWIDALAGIAIGVSVGLLSGAVVPLAIGQAAAASLSFGSQILVEAAGETVEALAAAGGKRFNIIPQVEGQDLQPGGIDPNLLASEIWRTLSRMYRGIAVVQNVNWSLPLLLGNTEYALGQLRLIEAGGDADMSQAELTGLALALVRANQAMRALDQEIDVRLPNLTTSEAQLDAAVRYPRPELEQDVWIIWMASLPNAQSDLLDLDEIEDRLHAIKVLGGASRLDVDFGRWTSEDDELEALAAARRAVGTIRARFEAITSGGGGG